MKRILILLLSIVSIYAHAQVPVMNNIVRDNTLTPARVANALDVMKPFIATGTNTYAVTITGLTTTYSAYASGDQFTIVFTNANSGASTVNITPSGGSAVGAVALVRNDGNALQSGDIVAGGTYIIRHNGTHFRVINLGTGGGGGFVAFADITGDPSDNANLQAALDTKVSRGELINEDVTGTTYTISDADAGKYIHFTNASGCLVTMDSDVSADLAFNFRRDEGAGTVTFQSDGTSSLNAVALTLEVGSPDVGVAATWTKRDAIIFEGVGQLGASAVGILEITQTPIVGGGAGNILYDVGGVLGVLNASGTGNVAMTTNGVFTTPNLGFPSAINLGNATNLNLASGVIGNLPVTHLNSGSGASGTTFWRGDGTWATPAGGGGGSGTVTDVTGSSPIVITGTSTVTPNVTINNAAADGSTKGAASFTAADFDASSGNIAIDYTNGTAASGSVKGFLTSADWTTFNNKQATGLSWLLASGGAQTADNTISGAFKTSFTTNSVGIGNSGTHAARLDVQGSGSTSSTSALMVGSAADPSIFEVRDDGVIRLGLAAPSMATSTYKIVMSSPPAYATGANRLWGVEGTSNYLGHLGVRIGTHNAGTIQSSGGNGIFLQTASDYIWYNFTSTGLGASNRMNRFSGIHTATAGSVTSTFLEITTGVDNNTTPQSNVSAIGIDYNPTNTGTITNHYAAIFRSGSIGIGTSTPTSSLMVVGSVASNANTTAVTTNTTLDVNHSSVVFDTSGGNVTVSLPDATGCVGREYTITNSSATNTLAVDPNGTQNLNGSSSNYNITGVAFQTITIKSHGALGWIIKSAN